MERLVDLFTQFLSPNPTNIVQLNEELQSILEQPNIIELLIEIASTNQKPKMR